jgi:hypothetical protein
MIRWKRAAESGKTRWLGQGEHPGWETGENDEWRMANGEFGRRGKAGRRGRAGRWKKRGKLPRFGRTEKLLRLAMGR